MELSINREHGRSRSGPGRVGGGNRFSGHVESEMSIRYSSGDVKNSDGSITGLCLRNVVHVLRTQQALADAQWLSNPSPEDSNALE